MDLKDIQIKKIGEQLNDIISQLQNALNNINLMATTNAYYVDATQGNDSNDGRSPLTAWQTIAKVNASSFVAGDKIFLKRGEVWRETLTAPNLSGTVASPIKFGAYGNGDMPVINGADIVTGFTLVSGSWDASVTTQPNVVLINGVKGTYKTSKTNCVNNGDWYWSANVLTVKWDTNPSGIIEVGARTQCVGGTGNYVTFDGIKFTGANTYGLFMTGTNITITNCNFVNIGGRGQNGIGTLINGNGWIISNNTITNIERQGIASATSSSKTIVVKNTLTNCWNGLQYGSGGDGRGIAVFGDGWLVARNKIYSCYVGIWHDNASNCLTVYNQVFNSQVNGIQHSHGISTKPNKIYNNSIIHAPTGTAGHGIVAEVSGDYCIIKNNAVYVKFTGTNANIQAFCIETASYTSIDIDYNIVYKEPNSTSDLYKIDGVSYNSLDVWKSLLTPTNFSGKAVHDIVANPMFVSLTDLHLQATSPCINVGIDVGQKLDFDEKRINGLPDIGAFEFAS